VREKPAVFTPKDFEERVMLAGIAAALEAAQK
jgi:hypothetical protein